MAAAVVVVVEEEAEGGGGGKRKRLIFVGSQAFLRVPIGRVVAVGMSTGVCIYMCMCVHMYECQG
jgi:hypothetical protein